MFGNPSKFTYVNKADMFDDVWNVLNSRPLAMSSTHLPRLFLTHHQLQDLQFVTHLPAKQNPTNWDVAASKYGVPSVFDLLHLVSFVCFLFMLEKFSHRIDNIIVNSWWGYGYTQRVVKVVQLQGVLYSISPGWVKKMTSHLPITK